MVEGVSALVSGATGTKEASTGESALKATKQTIAIAPAKSALLSFFLSISGALALDDR